MEQNALIRRGVGLKGVDHNKVSPGYVVYAHLTSTGTVRVVDNNGNEVHSWNLPLRPGRHARILPDGSLAYNGVHPEGPDLFTMWQKYRGGVMIKVSPAGKILSEYRDPYAHHDQHHLDNGELIYTTVEPLTSAAAATISGGIPGSEAPNNIVYGDCIKHVDPSTGELLWYWRAIDHLDPQKFKLNPHFDREHWPLINSVTVLKDGNILASLRSVSAVVVISRETGDILLHIDDNIVAQQHCASELDNGNILIFDNGTHRKNSSATFSRVIEVSRSTGEVVWSYVDKSMPMSFFSAFMGGAQRLRNGNTLITEAMFGRVFEVTQNGDVVWEYVNPHFANYAEFKDGGENLGKVGFDYPANAIFRAYKYTPDEIPWIGSLDGGEGMVTPASTP
ncbi:hypothetical protein BT63DRAFT_389045 [Microthyrium microscopicum]|uniref:PQQ enzyme repeat protein n=1 Tax=Microthyrium microscopicum TaxID=703497 RepID=A0A6A6UD49_9PEZI|nr:hypothetical protein BT63DRAFT_389045 [Microthyrium microscopicum]